MFFGSISSGADPMEDGKYTTPTTSDDKYDYFTGHYSKDPFVAESQREDWAKENKEITGESYRKYVGKKVLDKLYNDREPVVRRMLKKPRVRTLKSHKHCKWSLK